MINSEIQSPESDRVRVGECIVTLSSREVEVAGARRTRRLTPKSLGVLRVLMRQPGRVVTRDELFAEVWPDTLPTNDVLTQAVTQLRKAFGDDRERPRYIETIAKSQGAKGLAFIKCEAGEWKSPIVKFFSDEEKAALKQQLNIEDGDIVFFAAAPWSQASTILGRIRLESSFLLKARGRLTLPADQYNFLWVIEFPLMLWDEEEKRYISAHHPFTAPVKEDEPLLATDPAKVRGQHYDIVVNGVELGGGKVRREIDEFHAEADIGLIGTKTFLRLLPGHAGNIAHLLTGDFFNCSRHGHDRIRRRQ